MKEQSNKHFMAICRNKDFDSKDRLTLGKIYKCSNSTYFDDKLYVYSCDDLLWGMFPKEWFIIPE